MASLPQDEFPMLLAQFCGSKNLKSPTTYRWDLKKAGIFPLNKGELLNHLPRQDRSVNLDLVGDTSIVDLEQKRNDFS